jgi:uncharacterized protein (UPF0218 family)
MIKIDEKTKEILKTPLGRIVTYEEIKKINKKIISIGDFCTLGLIKNKIKIQVAVFDFKTKREEIGEEERSVLLKSAKFIEIENPAGQLNREIIKNARRYINEKTNIKIIGEEDLTALAFILELNEDEAVIYGQPNTGMVIVQKDEKLKERIREWIKK